MGNNIRSVIFEILSRIFLPKNNKNFDEREPLSDLEFMRQIDINLNNIHLEEVIKGYRGKLSKMFGIPESMLYPSDNFNSISNSLPWYKDWDALEIIVYLEEEFNLVLGEKEELYSYGNTTIGEWITNFLLKLDNIA